MRSNLMGVASLAMLGCDTTLNPNPMDNSKTCTPIAVCPAGTCAQKGTR